MATSPKLRIGFIGAGFIATYHSKSIRRAERTLNFGIERAGVFDVDHARAVAFAEASGHHVMASPDDVIESSDVVYICTWTSEHLDLVRKITQAGKASTSFSGLCAGSRSRSLPRIWSCYVRDLS